VARDLAGCGSLKRSEEMGVKFVIGEVSCFNSAPDQVCSGSGLRFKVVDEGPESTADPISLDRVADFSTDRVRHVHGVLVE
jgi:hypothetical protein